MVVTQLKVFILRWAALALDGAPWLARQSLAILREATRKYPRGSIDFALLKKICIFVILYFIVLYLLLLSQCRSFLPAIYTVQFLMVKYVEDVVRTDAK